MVNLFVFVSLHFSRVDNARLHVSIACDVFGRLQVDAMFGYHGRRKKSRSVVRIISSNQRNPRNPNLTKSMKSGLIERAHWMLVDRQMQSEITAEMHRWTLKLIARHVQILHQEIF